ncbi:MAG TPA: hypothetical protein DEG17_05170 [Cyanobacteria bacterium UBA11149]|nr:hypothetical protein [Cyanobacteria bacterium UBA11367]HBE60040.1 hypothetical protein [Cyanobacteria bacterium UBA11366]HBK63650.1 hypothetical protein [Cyanobacteria bacterium UBA11166]HBR75506.1 hypothetical protein [Cyanobacteria bacterium UBA11159]HBS71705.1 hypothetical protein [Cyanobacteria bacterium UBA11153]HBW88276.1 hypothetical protein [Cyanobacteria bacterium UBA11149]HCA97558.1 hypothetical protein [Cyanobacteria bacterium UBA9226]
MATDIDNESLSYTLDFTSLNKGITIDKSGRIWWTPTTNNIGINPVTVTVNDNNSSILQQTYNLTVTADTIAPKVNLIANKTTVDKGETVTLQATATDNIKVAGLQLKVNIGTDYIPSTKTVNQT